MCLRERLRFDEGRHSEDRCPNLTFSVNIQRRQAFVLRLHISLCLFNHSNIASASNEHQQRRITHSRTLLTPHYINPHFSPTAPVSFVIQLPSHHIESGCIRSGSWDRPTSGVILRILLRAAQASEWTYVRGIAYLSGERN